MEELSYVLTQYFVSSVHVRSYFLLPLIFTLLAASISHCLTATLNFHVFLPTKFVSYVFNHFRNFWVGCAAGTLEPLANTRTSSAEFCYPILG